MLSSQTYTPMPSVSRRPLMGARTWILAGLVFVSIGSLYFLFSNDSTLYLKQSLKQHFYLAPDPQSTELFPAPDFYDDGVWQDRNARTMHALVSCMAANSCHENQTEVVLLASPHFEFAIRGALSGENIWANAVMAALEDLGYSFLFSTSKDELIQQYRMMPNLVRAVIHEPGDVTACFQDRHCLKSEHNPLGIPFWKLFGFMWWDSPNGSGPLGARWTLSPERYHDGIFYLGYSVERACRRRAFVPHSERPNQAYILAKRIGYFYMDTYGWEDDYFTAAHEMHGIEFVAGMQNDTEFASHIPPATRNLGSLTQDEFLSEVARSRVLVGIGQPFLSPSPYDALCLGLPFINSVHSFDSDNPKDRSRWVSQHDPMMRLGEPYVYSVVKGDREGFEQAMTAALSTPIDSYVPPEMTHTAMRDRMAAFLEFDWRALGAEELANRTASGRELFVL